MAEYVLDEVKLLVTDLLGEDFGKYNPEDIAELEEALRTNDKASLEWLYAKWAERGPLLEDEPEVECEQCQRAVRFGASPNCPEHPLPTSL